MTSGTQLLIAAGLVALKLCSPGGAAPPQPAAPTVGYACEIPAQAAPRLAGVLCAALAAQLPELLPEGTALVAAEPGQSDGWLARLRLEEIFANGLAGRLDWALCEGGQCTVAIRGPRAETRVLDAPLDENTYAAFVRGLLFLARKAPGLMPDLGR